MFLPARQHHRDWPFNLSNDIGAVISKQLAIKGYLVILADIDLDAANKQARSIRSQGLQADNCYIDLANKSSIEDCVGSVIDRYGKIDGLVNNARPWLSHEKFPNSLGSWDLALSVLAKAPAEFTVACAPYLQSTNGAVVNISSTNAYFVSQQPITYHAAKSALEQITKYLAVELGPSGIRVNAILPGLVDQEDRTEKLSDSSENKRIIEAMVPLKRAGTPIDIANMVLFLLSQDSSYITGQSFIVDGGLSTLDHFYGAKKVLGSGS